MTGGARLRLYRRVLEDEWPAFVAMALETSRLVRVYRADHASGQHSSVRIVAVDAGHRPLGQTMLVRSLEARPHVRVALGALGVHFRLLPRHQTMRPVLVDRMARRAAHLVPGMTAINAAYVRRLIEVAIEAELI